MASGSESAAELTGRDQDATASRNVLSTVASAMFLSGCLLVCGLCAAGLYFFQPEVRDEPEAVEPLMADMLDVSVSPWFEPRGVIEWNLAFALTLRGAYYEMPDAESEGMLMFVEVQSWRGTEPEVQSHIEQALREKGGGVRELELMGDAEVRPLQVRGEPVRFTFETRRDPATDHTYRVIEGVVDGMHGAQVWIGVSVREEWTREDEQTGVDEPVQWDDAIFEEMIASIR